MRVLSCEGALISLGDVTWALFIGSRELHYLDNKHFSYLARLLLPVALRQSRVPHRMAKNLADSKEALGLRSLRTSLQLGLHTGLRDTSLGSPVFKASSTELHSPGKTLDNHFSVDRVQPFIIFVFKGLFVF